jgi:hypothetical protein
MGRKEAGNRIFTGGWSWAKKFRPIFLDLSVWYGYYRKEGQMKGAELGYTYNFLQQQGEHD